MATPLDYQPSPATRKSSPAAVSLRAPGRRRGLAIAGVVLNGLFLAVLAAGVAVYRVLGR